MIEIILEDGTSLDLKKDWEFEITLEQPMLDDSHIPIPYSTSIALPYTETNRLALKWLDALMLPPGCVKRAVRYMRAAYRCLPACWNMRAWRMGMRATRSAAGT